jgi:hypothetical protein
MLAAVIVLAVLLAAALVALAYFVMEQRRRAHLQERFGPEYERTLDDTGSRRQAERELAGREHRRQKLNITPLDAMRREAFAASWRKTQERFVDAPREAVAEADALVRDVMTERGYPMGDFDRQSADLSVDHPDVVGHYRAAHDIRTKDAEERGATTEELRSAMVHYRALFESLLAPEPAATEPATTQARS